MFSNKTKSAESTASKAVLQSVRYATAARGLRASRGLPVGTRVSSPAAAPSMGADRIGAAVTLLLSLALVAGGSFMVAQIWANLAMIR
jgi:hypothetical protein